MFQRNDVSKSFVKTKSRNFHASRNISNVLMSLIHWQFLLKIDNFVCDKICNACNCGGRWSHATCLNQQSANMCIWHNVSNLITRSDTLSFFKPSCLAEEIRNSQFVDARLADTIVNDLTMSTKCNWLRICPINVLVQRHWLCNMQHQQSLPHQYRDQTLGTGQLPQS